MSDSVPKQFSRSEMDMVLDRLTALELKAFEEELDSLREKLRLAQESIPDRDGMKEQISQLRDANLKLLKRAEK